MFVECICSSLLASIFAVLYFMFIQLEFLEEKIIETDRIERILKSLCEIVEAKLYTKEEEEEFSSDSDDHDEKKASLMKNNNKNVGEDDDENIKTLLSTLSLMMDKISDIEKDSRTNFKFFQDQFNAIQQQQQQSLESQQKVEPIKIASEPLCTCSNNSNSSGISGGTMTMNSCPKHANERSLSLSKPQELFRRVGGKRSNIVGFNHIS
jgi:hypothetical protein